MMSQSSTEVDDTLAYRVVEAVADTKDVDPISLQPPLGSVVDADALRTILAADGSSPVKIRFQYADCHVEVSKDDDVAVEVLQRTDD